MEQWGCTFYILPIGLPHTNSTKEFKELVEYSAERTLEFITGCDANSHRIVWCSSDVNPSGQDLREYLTAQELLVLNRGKTPMPVTRARQQVLRCVHTTYNMLIDTVDRHVARSVWTLCRHVSYNIFLSIDMSS